MRNAFGRRGGEDKATRLGQSNDIGGRRSAEEDGDLTEELAATELRPLLAIDLDGAGAVKDEEEAGAREPLAQDTRADGEPCLVELAGNGLRAAAR